MLKQKNQINKSNIETKDNNNFSNLKSMLATSVGRLPTALVMIILVSATMAAIAGIILELGKPSTKSNEFMPLRLEATQNSVAIDTKALQGNWVYQTPAYAMTFSFIGDRFEWIIAFADISEAQYYARGNYRLVGDVLVLGVRNDLGLPYDPEMPWMKYMPIAMKDVNVFISMEGKKTLIWTMPSSEQKRIISQPSFIFADRADGIFNWTKQ